MRPLSLVLLDLFFPARCIYCNALLPEADHFACPGCMVSLPWLSGSAALQSGTHFTRCVSAASYEASLRSAFLQYKFNKQRHLAKAFAIPLAQVISSHFSGSYDLITWVPVSKERLKTRGYDQSRLLAEALAQALGQKALPLLAHPRPKPAQSSLDGAAARLVNVKGCFAPTDPARTRGLRILLIDDLITTGATLEEAAGVLRAAGAREVLCATFCRALPPTSPMRKGEAPQSER